MVYSPFIGLHDTPPKYWISMSHHQRNLLVHGHGDVILKSVQNHSFWLDIEVVSKIMLYLYTHYTVSITCIFFFRVSILGSISLQITSTEISNPFPLPEIMLTKPHSGIGSVHEFGTWKRVVFNTWLILAIGQEPGCKNIKPSSCTNSTSSHPTFWGWDLWD